MQKDSENCMQSYTHVSILICRQSIGITLLGKNKNNLLKKINRAKILHFALLIAIYYWYANRETKFDF